MAGALGRAYIEVHADTGPFQRDLGPKLRKVVDGIKPDVDAAGHKMGQGLVDAAGEQVRKDGRKVAKKLEESINHERIRAHVSIDVDVDKSRGFFERLTAGVSSVFKKIGASGKGSGLGNSLLGSVITDTTDILKQVGVLGKGISTELLTFLAPLILAVGGMFVGALISTAGALSQLIGLVGLLPGAFGLAAGAIIPLVLSLHGFNDAISAILSNDPEQIAKALEKLAPAAASVAREFQHSLPFLKQVQQAAQQAFFEPIQGSWTNLILKNSPGLTSGISAIAEKLGMLTKALLDTASTPQAIEFFRNLSTTLQSIIGHLTGPFSHLIRSLFSAGNAALPTLDSLATRFGAWIDKFATFIEESIADGSFQAFLDGAVQTAGELKDLAGALFDLFKDIFAETKEGGHTFLQDVTQAISDLDAFFKSPEGRDSLHALVDLAQQLGFWLKAAAIAAGPLLAILTYAADITSGGIGNGNVFNPYYGDQGGGYAPGDYGGSGDPYYGGYGGPEYAVGGIFGSPTVGMIGEAGPEVLIPLNDRDRAQELVQKSGLMDLLGGSGGTVVNVWIGNEPIDARAMKVTTAQLDRTGRNLGRTPRELV